jgi:hypothetical protein
MTYCPHASTAGVAAGGQNRLSLRRRGDPHRGLLTTGRRPTQPRRSRHGDVHHARVAAVRATTHLRDRRPTDGCRRKPACVPCLVLGTCRWLPRRSRATRHGTHVVSSRCRPRPRSRRRDRHVRESAEPVGPGRKRDRSPFPPALSSARVVNDERAVAHQRLDPRPLAPGRDPRSSVWSSDAETSRRRCIIPTSGRSHTSIPAPPWARRSHRPRPGMRAPGRCRARGASFPATAG